MSTPDFAMPSSDQNHEELEALKARLFDKAMKRNWDHVIEAYKTTPMARRAQITKSRDTALHIAVSTGRSDIALKLLDVVYDSEDYDILEWIVNIEGNTPLHLAAAQGDLQVCRKIVSKSSPQVLTLRNNKGETPLFLAASHGRERTFFILHSHFPHEQLLRRSHDGNTALHMAVSGEYFSMALKIIKDHPGLADSLNENGESPLHLLANKPNAFKSSTRRGLLDRFIYYCQVVDIGIETEEEETFQEEEEEDNENYPENYDTCMIIIRTLQYFFLRFGRSLFGDDKKDDNKSDEENQSGKTVKKHRLFPPNYDSCVSFFKFILKLLLAILGVGIWRLNKIRKMKRRHILADLLMNELVGLSRMLYASGSEPKKTELAEILYFLDDIPDISRKLASSPILIAAKTGIVEMVAKILEDFPVAIQDVDSNGKNVVLLAVENRQPHVYDLLVQLNKKKVFPKENVFSQVDDTGNSALHLAATYVERVERPSLIHVSALQMQLELKWYEFVKKSMPLNFFASYNFENKTPKDVFLGTHKKLIEEASEWLTKMCESCSVVAVLVASVAFATASTVPGGIKPESGAPMLENKPPFITFAMSSLFALCSSVTALVFFLSIVTSRHRYKDFAVDLPRKLLLACTFLFISIVSMLTSFFGGHSFILKDELRDVTYPLYAALCFPLAFYTGSLLSLFIDLLKSIFQKIPQKI